MDMPDASRFCRSREEGLPGFSAGGGGEEEEVEVAGGVAEEKPEGCLGERGRFARRERGVWRG